jgi:hypothetical protein
MFFSFPNFLFPKDVAHNIRVTICGYFLSAFSFQNGIYVEHRFIPVSEEWVQVSHIRIQVNLDLLVHVIPVVDIAQLVFDFLNHENETWDTSTSSMTSFTRVFNLFEEAATQCLVSVL